MSYCSDLAVAAPIGSMRATIGDSQPANALDAPWLPFLLTPEMGGVAAVAGRRSGAHFAAACVNHNAARCIMRVLYSEIRHTPYCLDASDFRGRSSNL